MTKQMEKMVVTGKIATRYHSSITKTTDPLALLAKFMPNMLETKVPGRKINASKANLAKARSSSARIVIERRDRSPASYECCMCQIRDFFPV